MKRFLGWILALMLLVSCMAPMVSAADTDSLKEEFVQRINQYRSSYGVSPLQVDATLASAAQLRSTELPVRFDHTRPDGTKYYSITEKAEAECYYSETNRDIENSAQTAATWFMNSRTHREILMDSRVQSIGVGIYQVGSTTYYDVLLSTSPADAALGQSSGSSNPSVPAQSGFQDVRSSDYFASAVSWAVSRGIAEGMTDSAFAPNAPCTRAQIVTFLWRAAGSPRPSLFARNRFSDVRSSDYFYNAVRWAQGKGITSGVTGTSFAPNKTCTRAEAVTLLWRYRGSPSTSAASGFSDVPSGAWYAQAVSWASANGITSGVSAGRFGPNLSCTRGQIITFLYRAIG